MLSLDYDDTIMAAAGHQAEQCIEDIRRDYKGQFILAVEGNPPLGERRHVLHPGRAPVRGAPEGSGRGLRRRHRLGLVRLLGLRAGREAEPDAGHADPQGDHRQADHQGAGLPADRRGHDGRHHLLPDLRRTAGARSPGPPADVLQPARARQVLSPAATSTPASSPRPSTTQARAWATACTRSAAADRRPTTPARRCAGTRQCRSRSARATAASAAPSRTSGTTGPSTSGSTNFPQLGIEATADKVGATAATIVGVGIAAHAGLTALRQAKVKPNSPSRESEKSV